MTNVKIRPIVEGFFEKRTNSVQYIVADPSTRCCAIIDPVLDFDEKSGATATSSAGALLDHIRRNDYLLQWILDTHPHADHLSAAGYLKDKTGVAIAIGEKIHRGPKAVERTLQLSGLVSNRRITMGPAVRQR